MEGELALKTGAELPKLDEFGEATPLIASRLVGRRADLHERSGDFSGKEPGPRSLVTADATVRFPEPGSSPDCYAR